MFPEFPQELVDEVIDHLWDDVTSLRACSLSCSTWLPTSRTHLFRQVDLRDAAACARFIKLLEASPVLVQYIRKLSVDAHHFSYDLSSLRNGDSTWLPLVPPLLGALPRVTELEMTSLNWRTLQLDPKHTELFYSMLGNVKRLALVNVHFESSSDVLNILSAAKLVTELHLDRVYWNCWSWPMPDGLSETGEMPHCGYLQRLVLRSGSPPNAITDWLLATGSMLNLREVQVHWRERDSTQALGALVRASGSRLERLYLELTNGVATQAAANGDLDLAHLTGLRAVYFDGLVLPDCCEWITSMTAQLHSDRLEMIEVSLLARWQDDLRAIDWVQLDKTLAHERFACVTLIFKVNLAIYNANNQDDAGDIVRSALPGFRGTLVVKYT